VFVCRCFFAVVCVLTIAVRLKVKYLLEAHTGLGRSDMIIYLNQQEYLIEVKIFTNQTKFRKGKKQLAYYCQSLALKEGIYLVFSPQHLKFTQMTTDSIENIEGIDIYTYMVVYDEETDF
jgi:hypothetical protein